MRVHTQRALEVSHAASHPAPVPPHEPCHPVCRPRFTTWTRHSGLPRGEPCEGLRLPPRRLVSHHFLSRQPWRQNCWAPHSLPRGHSPGTASSGPRHVESPRVPLASVSLAWRSSATLTAPHGASATTCSPFADEVAETRGHHTAGLAFHPVSGCRAWARWPLPIGPEPAVLGSVPSCCPGATLQQKQQICSETLEQRPQLPSGGAPGASRAWT